MMLDLNEAEHWEQTQATAAAEAREAKNRRRLGVVVMVATCVMLLVGKSAIPRRPNGLFSPRQLLLKDRCAGVTCLNGGACDSRTGLCVCPTGFSGPRCEDSLVDKCDNVVCLNSGACNPLTGLCVCPAAFTGPFCETPVNLCANVVCLNGGACNSSTGLCVCPPGYTGVQCQILVASPGVKTVFVTARTFSGDLGGLTGADRICQDIADSWNVAGTFRAWLSDNSQSATSRLTHSTDPYKLRNGDTVASNWNDLVNGNLVNPIDRNIAGFQIFLDPFEVWTGTNAFGNGKGGNCRGWSSVSFAQQGLAGSASSSNDDWTDNNELACNNFRRLYCFEQ